MKQMSWNSKLNRWSDRNTNRHGATPKGRATAQYGASKGFPNTKTNRHGPTCAAPFYDGDAFQDTVLDKETRGSLTKTQGSTNLATT